MKQKKLLFNHIVTYPTPYNISYLYSFGFLAGFILMNQIITGLILAMFYLNSGDHAFDSLEFIMRNVNYGWLIRYLHSNGASFFFIILYLHISKALYYKSFMYPRQKVWYSGLILYFLVMATAFLGYVLPWGQMSFWGATVITNLISVIPFIGDNVVQWIWCGYSVNAKTLQRFFIIHYILPFVILGLVMLHIVFLHEAGSSNPLNLDKKNEKIDFFPYFYIKDIFITLIILIGLIIIVCFYSNIFNHADNFIKANPMSTPHHIVPEWYFLPFYAILRAIASKTIGIIMFLVSLVIYFFLPIIHTDQLYLYNNFFETKSTKFKNLKANVYIFYRKYYLSIYFDFIGIISLYNLKINQNKFIYYVLVESILFVNNFEEVLNKKINNVVKYCFEKYLIHIVFLDGIFLIYNYIIYLLIKWCLIDNFKGFKNGFLKKLSFFYLIDLNFYKYIIKSIIIYLQNPFILWVIVPMIGWLFETFLYWPLKIALISILVNNILYPIIKRFKQICIYIIKIIKFFIFILKSIKINKMRFIYIIEGLIKVGYIYKFLILNLRLMINKNIFHFNEEYFENFKNIKLVASYNKLNKNLYNLWFYNNNLYYRQLFWMLVVIFISLGYVGQMEVNTVSIELGQDLTLLYFLILLLFSFPNLISIFFVYFIFFIMFILTIFGNGFFANLEDHKELPVYATI